MATEAGAYAALTDIFRDVFQKDVSLRPELTARDVAGWDSFKQIEIIMAVEERFAIRLTTREMDGLHTVGDLIRVVIAKTATG
ncbi:MAG TPA: acyl carrier protein [Acetobacteraceae bacterium]|nr:acyl carrier protein [Acetobacteraceae bacterium]